MDGWIDDHLYAQIEASIPILCVDFLLRREGPDGPEYGLARRHSPFGEVWCQFGGRMHYGETIADALRRHADESIADAKVAIDQDPQPLCAFPWFPEAVEPRDGSVFGRDPRKHSVGLGFILDVEGEPRAVPGGEALDIAFFTEWPEGLWPGCRGFFDLLLR